MATESVNLKDFIAKVIEDVYNGANKGKRNIQESKTYSPETTDIDFDLAVTSTTDKSSGTNGQIAVSVLNWVNLQAGGQSTKGTIVSQANRIHFKIPLTLREAKKSRSHIKTANNPLDSEAGY